MAGRYDSRRASNEEARLGPTQPAEAGRGMSRGSFLATTGLTLAGAPALSVLKGERTGGSVSDGVIPFYGRYQAGIATEAPNHLSIAAFDLAPQSRANIRDLMRAWTDAAARMTLGQPAGGPNNAQKASPFDTGEAVGLAPSQLTITFGFGASIFEMNGEDRFGLLAHKPEVLKPLPQFRRDAIDPTISNGDIVIQACAADPQVAFHAIHELRKIGLGAAGTRWQQMGFGRTSATTSSQSSARNLMGFKDGTNNLRSNDDKAMNQWVWLGTEGPRWMTAGTYMVIRRIRMRIDTWDAANLREQERTFGRRKLSGAPLTGTHEDDPVDLKAVGANGRPVIPLDAHIRVSGPEANGGRMLLRRGYSYSSGVDANMGALDLGLIFICFQRDPFDQFVRIQQNLSENDHMNHYVEHIGSALFAIPPGARSGEYVGERLFG